MINEKSQYVSCFFIWCLVQQKLKFTLQWPYSRTDYHILIYVHIEPWSLDLHSSYAIGTTHFYICQSRVVLDTTLWNIVCRLFSWHSVSSTYKTRHHDISKIMLKVVLHIHYMFRIKLHTFTIYSFEQGTCIKLLIFYSINLNGEENKAVFKSVQTFIIKSKGFTPWHDHIILFTFSILFNLFVLIFSTTCLHIF